MACLPFPNSVHQSNKDSVIKVFIILFISDELNENSFVYKWEIEIGTNYISCNFQQLKVIQKIIYDGHRHVIRVGEEIWSKYI